MIFHRNFRKDFLILRKNLPSSWLVVSVSDPTHWWHVNLLLGSHVCLILSILVYMSPSSPQNADFHFCGDISVSASL